MRLSDRASRDDPQNKGSVPSFHDIDAEQIFWVCTNRMRPLGETLEKIIADLEQGSNER